MATVLRALLWTAVVVAPGGVLLLPLLVVDARRRNAEPGSAPGDGVPADAVTSDSLRA